MTENSTDEIAALNAVISALQPLTADSRRRILEMVRIFFRDTQAGAEISALVSTHASRTDRPLQFSENLSVSPKEFLLEKQPRTDVERVACLAFYLTHYRNLQFFKTPELIALNTEAAQPKFSNPHYSVNNATQAGYLAGATKDMRQISAAGEQFVRALPDREAARQAMLHARPKRRGKKTKNDQSSSEPDED